MSALLVLARRGGYALSSHAVEILCFTYFGHQQKKTMANHIHPCSTGEQINTTFQTTGCPEKTPPKNPNPKDKAVAMILATRIVVAANNSVFPVVRFTIVEVPNPITSG